MYCGKVTVLYLLLSTDQLWASVNAVAGREFPEGTDKHTERPCVRSFSSPMKSPTRAIEQLHLELFATVY